MSQQYDVDPTSVKNFLILGLPVLLITLIVFGAYFIVPPGSRGILVTMGKVNPVVAQEGLGFKSPFITDVINVTVRQQTESFVSDCYSSDLQQLKVEMKILYRIPEASVVKIFQDYSGNPFQTLVVPRVHEALKEVTAQQSAETIVKKREDIKLKAMELSKAKIGDLIFIEDIVIQDISLSKELENAIEAKMVQEQEAAKSKFIQQKAEIEAKTAFIKAQGEANAIRVRGEALKQNPALINLQIVEKWDGKAPLVVGGAGGGGGGSNIILPLGNFQVK